jgi:signal transduction histidine kinase
MTRIDAPVEGPAGVPSRPDGHRRLASVARTFRPISGAIAGQQLDPRRVARLERVLAVGRAFLTVSALTAIYLDPTQPARLAAVTYAVLASYAVYSLAVLVYVHRAAQLKITHGHVLHGFDVLWTAALTFVSEGPVSPFFLFFLFVVLSAAYRWGFVGTIVTTCVTVGVFLVQTAIAAVGPWSQTWLTSIEVELNETILRIAYLLLTGFLLGYLAEQEKQSRAELAAIADITRQPRVRLGLGGSVLAVAQGLLRTFDAHRVHFVLLDYETRQAFLWQVDPTSASETPDGLRVELNAEEHRTWLFADPGRAWYASRESGETELRARVVEPGGWPLRHITMPLPTGFAEEISFSRIIAANFGLADEWRGRVYLFDPSSRVHPDQSVHFLDALADYITPALTNVFLLGRLRARATAEERARVARELHDGTIQALLGIEMKVQALRRGPSSNATGLDVDLDDIQGLLHREALALRELMQALRPIPLDTGDQLPDVLASLVERFRRDTGLLSRFVFAGGSVALPPTTALEIVRIVQEALVNVRKHSSARNVLVRLTGGEDGCALVIEDDGVGLEFEGRLAGDELDQRRLGPLIIRERARIAGAQLVIDSSRGSGTRIEVRVPARHV